MAELAIALDMPDRQSAVSLAEKLSAGLDGVAGKVWFKVGMELYTAAGPAVVEAIKTLGFAVFLDLKYHDIPNTVAGAMRAAARLKVDMANVHICGGEAMVRAAVAGAREGAEFVKAHIIRVTEKAFDDFADAGTDQAASRRMLGL